MADAGTLVNATTQYINATTGAVTPFDANNSMSATMKTFYDTSMLENSRENLVFAQLGDPENLPAGEGMTVEWRIWNTLPDADRLTEGVIPAGKKFGLTSQNVSIVEHGLYVAITKQLDLHATDPVILGATEEIGASLGRTYDKLVRSALLEGTNVLYADARNKATDAFVSKTAGRYLLSDQAATFCGLSPDMIAQAVTKLEAADAPTYDGMNYVAVVHPYLAYDLRATKGWIEAHQYAGSKNIFTNELGELNGVRFVKSTLAPIIKGAPLSAGARNLTVASFTAGTRALVVSETLTEADATALAGRLIIVDGVQYEVEAAVHGTKTLTLTAASLSGVTNVPAKDDVVYPGEGGAGGIAIFPVMFFGKGAFKVVNPEGAGMETIVKSKQQIGGPLEQFSTVGGKFSGAAKIVYPERLVTLECASAYSATAEAN